MKKARIRALTSVDLPAVQDIISACGLFRSALDNDNVGGIGNRKNRTKWLACDIDGPVAVACYAPESMANGTWNLHLIAVHPDHQGSGLGASLVEHVEQKLLSSGERILVAEVSGFDQFRRSRNFFRKNGYHEEARLREYYQVGEDKIIFRKTLSKN